MIRELFSKYKTLIIILGSIIGVLCLFNFIDDTSNGRILTLISDMYSYENSWVEESGTVHVEQILNWPAIKLMAIDVLIVLTIFVVVVVTAITKQRENALKEKLKQKEWELEVENQKKNDLITYIVHDLKTPLTSVIGYLNLLKEAPDMPLEQRIKFTNIGLDKAMRLETLINEFFDIARYNLQKIQLAKEDINLSYMLEQMIDEFYPILQSENLEVDADLAENVTIQGDADNLARVFNNVLKNAIAYSTSGTIKVSLRLDSEESPIGNTDIHRFAIVQISNPGKTIPAEKLSMIFEKFYRLDEARSSNTGGAGLGLAIAKQIVELHSGEIFALSENGITTFTVKIPA